MRTQAKAAGQNTEAECKLLDHKLKSHLLCLRSDPNRKKQKWEEIGQNVKTKPD